MTAEVRRERICPDALDRLNTAVVGIELASPLRFAETSPVGGLIARAAKTSVFGEGFEHDGAIRIAILPVIPDASADQSENFRR